MNYSKETGRMPVYLVGHKIGYGPEAEQLTFSQYKDVIESLCNVLVIEGDHTKDKSFNGFRTSISAFIPGWRGDAEAVKYMDYCIGSGRPFIDLELIPLKEAAPRISAIAHAWEFSELARFHERKLYAALCKSDLKWERGDDSLEKVINERASIQSMQLSLRRALDNIVKLARSIAIPK